MKKSSNNQEENSQNYGLFRDVLSTMFLVIAAWSAEAGLFFKRASDRAIRITMAVIIALVLLWLISAFQK